MEWIESDQVGFNAASPGPFGDKSIVYADYTASGRALHCIEGYIQGQVLPVYANTHSETSYCSRQTTNYREEARDIIRDAVNASDNDHVLFTGSGCTGAVHKLIHLLNFQSNPVRITVLLLYSLPLSFFFLSCSLLFSHLSLSVSFFFLISFFSLLLIRLF
jgi:selenocysteine lyase/cysteine desulfurase